MKPIIACSFSVLNSPEPDEIGLNPFDLPPANNSVIGLRRLASIGCRIAYVTNISHQSQRQFELWLKRHRFPNPYSIRCLGSNGDRVAAMAALGVKLSIEGIAREAEQVASHGLPVILLDPSGNKSTIHPGVLEVRSWDQVVQWVKDRLLARQTQPV